MLVIFSLKLHESAVMVSTITPWQGNIFVALIFEMLDQVKITKG